MMLPVMAAVPVQLSPLASRATAVRPSPPAMARTVSEGEARSTNSEPLVDTASSRPAGGEKAPMRSFRLATGKPYCTQAALILPASSVPDPPKS